MNPFSLAYKKTLILPEISELDFEKCIMAGATTIEFRGPSDAFTACELIAIGLSNSFKTWNWTNKTWLWSALEE